MKSSKDIILYVLSFFCRLDADKQGNLGSHMLKRAEPKDKKEPRFLSHFVEGYLLARNNHTCVSKKQTSVSLRHCIYRVCLLQHLALP